MGFVEEFKSKLFQINDNSFVSSSLALYDYQYRTNELYRKWSDFRHKNPSNVKEIEQIPYMPIEFFKKYAVKCTQWKSQKIFRSSGTTASGRSAHHIEDVEWYHQISRHIFENQFEPLQNLQILALLPSYQKQGDSSLVSMVDYFLSQAAENSGHISNVELDEVLSSNHPKVLFGVAYALLSLKKTITSQLTVIETGGMKGRREEITRETLHDQIQYLLAPSAIWSEYGMTELQSQSYGLSGLFKAPKWMKISIREINDPFHIRKHEGATGGINIIDLANVSTCAFIETKDLGRIKKSCFEILGRFDNSELRGCNLLYNV